MPTFAFMGEIEHTLGFRRKIAHSGPHAETRAFRTGPLSLPSARTARSQTSPGRVSERQTLPFWGLGQLYSRRAQKAFGTAMRLCASLFRGVAAPLGCVIFLFLSKLWLVCPALRAFRACERGGGITLRVLLKRRTAACQSGSFAVSLCPLFTFVKDPAGHYQYPH